MKTPLLPLLVGGLLLVGCTDKKDAQAAEGGAGAESTDLLPSDAEVEAIDAQARKAAEAITEENADDALGALEAELEAGDGE